MQTSVQELFSRRFRDRHKPLKNGMHEYAVISTSQLPHQSSLHLLFIVPVARQAPNSLLSPEFTLYSPWQDKPRGQHLRCWNEGRLLIWSLKEHPFGQANKGTLISSHCEYTYQNTPPNRFAVQFNYAKAVHVVKAQASSLETPLAQGGREEKSRLFWK